MKTIAVWPGAVVGIGEGIEIKMLVTERGELKLGVIAPPEVRIARQHGTPPRGRRRLINRKRQKPA